MTAAFKHIHSRKELQQALEKLRSISMKVVGDAIVDRYIWGDVERISPEAPVPVLDVRRAEDRLGGAANVAHNLSQLGIPTTLIALVGDDDEADALSSLLGAAGINASGLVRDADRCTTVKTRVMAGQQQICRIDHEVRTVAAPQIEQRLCELLDVQDQSGIIVSDYGKGAVDTGLLSTVARLVENRSVMVDPHPKNYTLYKRLGMCKPNRKEAESATGMRIFDNPSASAAATKLLDLWGCEIVVLSLGAGGVCIAERSAQTLFLPTQARQVFDVSGAGDTLAAVFAAGKQAGLSTVLAGELANIAAGAVVSQVGTVPVTRGLLDEELSHLPS